MIRIIDHLHSRRPYRTQGASVAVHYQNAAPGTFGRLEILLERAFEVLSGKAITVKVGSEQTCSAAS